MGAHIVNGQFQSDKYPTCPPGKVPLSVKDPTAQDLLWEYAQRRRTVDSEFSDDLEQALLAAGYENNLIKQDLEAMNEIFRLASELRDADECEAMMAGGLRPLTMVTFKALSNLYEAIDRITGRYSRSE